MKLCGKAKAMSMFAGKTKKKERKKILNNSELVSGDTCIFVCFYSRFLNEKEVENWLAHCLKYLETQCAVKKG